MCVLFIQFQCTFLWNDLMFILYVNVHPSQKELCWLIFISQFSCQIAQLTYMESSALLLSGRTRPDHMTSSDGAGRMSHGPALLHSGEKYGIRILKKFIQITFASLPSENLWILPQALEKSKIFIIGLLLLVPEAVRSLSWNEVGATVVWGSHLGMKGPRRAALPAAVVIGGTYEGLKTSSEEKGHVPVFYFTTLKISRFLLGSGWDSALWLYVVSKRKL